ncbi:VWA domain-containing protein [uncultured Paludibaculum sp.]|uniref:VWA domain-containing protein n=1 Tax=uncultured Paludibaculum sp. TaxID=1765020 RepID=UPI002AAB643F|nr:VWA domain-containing protein [uncultured Paludibaculum sp.]
MVFGKLTMAVALASMVVLPQQGPDTPIIRMNVELVQVDAVVHDGKGKPVIDLRAEDFEIKQDGKVQRITNFSYVAEPGRVNPAPAGWRAKGEAAPPPAKAKNLSAGEVRRTMALVVDDLGLSAESVLRAKEALLKFVDERMEPGDLVAVLRTGESAGTLQRFTTDKRQLKAAIRQIKFNFRSRVGTDSVRQLFDDRSAAELGGGKKAAKPETPAEKEAREREQQEQSARSTQAALDRDRQEASDNRERDHIAAGTLGVLRYLLQGMRPMPGRKSVVLLSESLALRQNDASTIGIWDRLRGLTDMANRSGVVFYAVDPRGQEVLGLRAEDQVGAEFDTPNPRGRPSPLDARRQTYMDSRMGLSFLAAETGGLYLEGSNDVSALLGRAADDQGGYYLIGYHPEAGTFRGANDKAKYHDIKVRVKRAGLRSRSRNGFYNTAETAMAAVPKTHGERVVNALVSPFAANEIGVRLTSLFDVDGASGPSVFSMLHINARDLHFVVEPDGRHKAAIDVVTATFGEDGRLGESRTGSFTLRANEARYQRLMENGVIFTIMQPLKETGPFQLRAVVSDPDGEKLGSATQFIDVPNLKDGHLALSGIMLTLATNEAVKKLAGRTDGGEQDAQDSDGSAAIRHFRRGQKVAYGYKVLNAALDATREPQLMTAVRLYRDGQEVFHSDPRPLGVAGATDKSKLMVGGVLQLGQQFEPGDYALQVVVWDKLVKPGRNMVSQAIDFELQ